MRGLDTRRGKSARAVRKEGGQRGWRSKRHAFRLSVNHVTTSFVACRPHAPLTLLLALGAHAPGPSANHPSMRPFTDLGFLIAFEASDDMNILRLVLINGRPCPFPKTPGLAKQTSSKHVQMDPSPPRQKIKIKRT